MKSLLIASGVLSALIMTGCATNKAPITPDQAPDGKPHKHHHKGEKGNKPHKHGKNKSYTCDGDTTIQAKHQFHHKSTVLNITAPSLGLNGQDITLTHLKKDKPQSDDRQSRADKADKQPRTFEFVNDTNANAKYHWKTSGKDAVLSITTPNATHTIHCQDDRPMPPHGKPKADKSMDKPTP